MALKFLRSNPHRACSLQICYYARGRRKEYWEEEEAKSRNGLHIAASFGLWGLAEELLDSGECDVKSLTKMGTTPLIVAAANGHKTFIRMLLDKGVDLVNEDWYGSALHCAAESGKLVGISELLSTGINVDLKDSHGCTPLHCATLSEHAHAMQSLLDHGTDVNAVDLHLYTPLRYAVVWKHHESILEVLLRNGADMEMRSGSGFTVLHLAANMELKDLLLLLLNYGAEVDAKHLYGNVALHFAAEQDNADIVHILLERGASIEARTFKGATALCLAAQRGADPTVNLLLEHGTNTYVAGNNQLTPLLHARKEKHGNIIRAILKARVGTKVQGEDGEIKLDFPFDGEFNESHRLLSQLEESRRPNIMRDLALIHKMAEERSFGMSSHCTILEHDSPPT